MTNPNDGEVSASKKINRREIRGLRILSTGGHIEKLSEHVFRVKSQSDQGILYRINLVNDEWSCDCLDFIKRKENCKHICAIILALQMENHHIIAEEHLSNAKEETHEA